MRSNLVVRVKPAGDQAVTVEFADVIDEAVNARVIALDNELKANPIAGITETVPTYRSLLVFYEPSLLRGRALISALQQRAEAAFAPDDTSSRHFTVPVCYEGEDALDLTELADTHNMSEKEVIAHHTGATYRVFMIGFAPGFTYLGGLPEAIHTPRLKEPRQRVPAGAIGIGGAQAAINSVAGPSGWRYIGRTPVRLFAHERSEPALFRAGDIIRFSTISPDAIAALDRRVLAGEAILEPEQPW